MRKSVIAGIVIAAAAVLVALYFLLDRGEGPARLRIPADPGLGAGAESPDAAASSEAELPQSRTVEPIRPMPYVEPEMPATRTAADDDFLRVLVVDEATGLPVPEAEVAWTDDRLESEVRRGPFSTPSSLISDFDHAPQRAVTDLRGIAVIRTSERLLVAARSGALFAFRSFTQAPRGEIRVALMPGPFIAARVVSDSGAPAPGMMVWFSISTSRLQMSAVSRSPDGLAIAHHPGVKNESGSLAESGEVTATLQGSGSKDGVKATLDQLREGPITLVLAPTGRLVVKLLDVDGKPLLADARVSVSATRSSKSGDAEFRCVASGGTAEFPWVPVGASLSLSAETADLDSISKQKVETLLTPGEYRTVEVRFLQRRATVKGRAVDEVGLPLVKRQLALEIVTDGSLLVLPDTARVETNAEGEFKLVLDRQAIRRQHADLLLEIRGAPHALERHGVIAMPKLSDAQETQLGDVALKPPEALASGIVRDELGTPLGGALVMTEGLQIVRTGSLTIGARNAKNFYRGHADEAGAFMVPMPAKTSGRILSLGLKAEMAGYVCTDPPAGLKPGAKDVAIVLRGAGVVEGHLLLPDLAPVRKLSLHVALVDAAGGGAKTDFRFEDCVDSGGGFRLPGIRPGVATVTVRLRGASEPLASISDVTVPRLAKADDVRLGAIDLREHPALRR